ncbi:D-alanyl-D-alanine carboxypeptidase/D-alanyl-D-alanine-endopeptidase [Jatrophihabitans sp.]|uniref:D-alanyl-D-alanine carboxypeptidase/D-alanyl-D-alanine endopeptidase n=1 Tax=Jatrophihabitans sp. TaxID=1932789 RepID=UPI0030C675E5
MLLIIALSLAAAAGAYFGTQQLRREHGDSVVSGVAVPEPIVSAGATPSPAVTPAAAPVPRAAAVAADLAATLRQAALGTRLRARIADAATGAVLYDDHGGTGAAPASTAKLLTAAAILTVHPADYRFTTSVAVSGSTVVLVGGGDPTLSGAAAGHSGAYPQAARLSDLATKLRAAHVSVSRIVVDDALFAGPAISPDWEAEDVPSSYGAGITAVMTDGGRAAPGDYLRSSTPDLAAGAELAALLGKPGLPVTRGAAPATATTTASVRSAPLSVLIEQMLHDSDNVIAEVLARQVAVATHVTSSFLGAAKAIATVLGTVGVQVGSGMRDGSGLAVADRVSPAALVQLLRVAAGYLKTTTPTSAGALIAALPVAAWSGTLQDRYRSGPAAAVAGEVRAKTGSLTGVTSLAGYVHDRSGRLLVFSLDADRTPATGTAAAESALDRVVAALGSCGCS